jgi:hypothetical protein
MIFKIRNLVLEFTFTVSHTTPMERIQPLEAQSPPSMIHIYNLYRVVGRFFDTFWSSVGPSIIVSNIANIEGSQ